MPLLPLFVLILVGLAAPLRAQQFFSTEDTIQLPSLAVGAADHATIATNSYGDVFIANHADAPTGTKLVEGTAIASLGNLSFRAAPIMLLGDPSLSLLGLDTCRKPDVVALGDGSFVVSWPRNEANSLSIGRLEAARIVMRDPAGALLPVPTVQTAAPGEGFVVDPRVLSGDAGVMPDLVWLGDQDPLGCAIVYVHETQITKTSTKEFREYDLRCTRIDWSQPASSSTFRDGPFVLVAPVPIDNLKTTPFVGGLVLPDVVLDDSGDLVVAFEESIVAPHLGSTTSHERIRVSRFRPFSDAAPLQLIDTVIFTDRSTTHRPRRPNLSSSRHDLLDSVSISYGLQGLFGAVSLMEYETIPYLPGGVGGYNPPRDAYWVDDPQNPDGIPAVATCAEARSCFAIRQYPNQRRLIASISRASGSHSQNEIITPIRFPWRPAAELVPFTASGSGNDFLFAAICYEGDDTLTPSTYRIYFTYRQL